MASENPRKRRYKTMHTFRKKLQRWVLIWVIFWITLVLAYWGIEWFQRLVIQV